MTAERRLRESSAVIDRRYRDQHSPPQEILDRKNRASQPATMNSLNRFADPVYCFMRLLVGLMFACHGAQKILGWFAKPGQASEPLDAMMTTGGWIELVCGLLIAIGLLTRPAAFLASGMMAVAFFMVHAKGSFIPIVNHGEAAVLYCWIFLFVFFHGPGRISVDALMKRGTATSVPTS
jgi:putative oxidoreductase